MGRKAGYTHTEKQKEHLRNKMLGKPRPEYVCDKISKTMRDKFASGELFRKKKHIA